MIKEMPVSERPRERLLRNGKESLSNVELFALLLGSGTKDKSVKELAFDLEQYLESVPNITNVEVEELTRIKGIKIAKATKVIAAIEIGRRLSLDNKPLVTAINEARDVYNLLHRNLENKEQEHFIVIYLNTKSAILKYETIFIGTVNQTLIHPREIYKTAVKLNSSAVILVHNHPSGHCNPSTADRVVTKELIKAGKILGIEVIDHIIIGKSQYYSVIREKMVVV